MRARVVLLLFVAAVAAVLGACGGPAAPRAATAVPDGVHRIELAFHAGEVIGGVTRFAVPLGSTVELVVGSDVADEVHLHGYDRSSFVTAGATTTLRFVADLPGVFDVELEQRRIPLTQVLVS
ncbi:hypothetical protein WEH80_04110 [Actinomycetes bacterium KLBMP 9759]